MTSAAIELSPYNTNWPKQFEQEKAFLSPLLAPWIGGSIEHVGSTSVPGLTAKPIIDIMVGVTSLAASKEAIEVLTQNGYCYYPYKPDVMHWFCKPSDAFRTHHLHLIPFDSELWHQRLLFRDRLRNHPELANEYQTLKIKLAEQYRDDREAYTQKKWPFIKEVLNRQ
ncbi:GrpB family protein [Pleionea sp. CnH1-48]|uniref:GrpB family protein n=1 Tax=Pleionea sp. CnH1-48 TaxID=2954494 RepID=UPI0020977DB3|nr:GrpB family protein [Pleionea sp. CnH1-48]MCO7223533.1 GrpB family protein [Pleionea sp. CnH1-48]